MYNFEGLSKGVRMIIMEMLREAISSRSHQFGMKDLVYAFGLLYNKDADEKYFLIVSKQINKRKAEILAIDYEYLQITFSKLNIEAV